MEFGRTTVTIPDPPRFEPPRRTEPVLVPTVIRDEPAACPDPDGHYACETVTGLDADAWQDRLRARWTAGYRLTEIVTTADGSLLVFEHAHG